MPCLLYQWRFKPSHWSRLKLEPGTPASSLALSAASPPVHSKHQRWPVDQWRKMKKETLKKLLPWPGRRCRLPGCSGCLIQNSCDILHLIDVSGNCVERFAKALSRTLTLSTASQLLLPSLHVGHDPAHSYPHRPSDLLVWTVVSSPQLAFSSTSPRQNWPFQATWTVSKTKNASVRTGALPISPELSMGQGQEYGQWRALFERQHSRKSCGTFRVCEYTCA